MPTTTNYGWTTPADTDLVKDGAAAIRTLGSSIDTTVFNNANAAIAKTIVDAKGDIIAATAADTVSRLAVGANDTVLTADSSTATGLKWAAVAGGGMTLLSTTTLSGSETIISSINQGYNTLRIWIYGVTNATANGIFWFQVRNSTTALDWNGIGPALNSMPADIYSSVGNRLSTDSDGLRLDRTNATNFWVMEINNYASTTDKKHLSVSAGYYDNTVSKYVGRFLDGVVQSNSAIDSLRLWNNGGDFNSGTVKIYGVK